MANQDPDKSYERGLQFIAAIATILFVIIFVLHQFGIDVPVFYMGGGTDWERWQ